MTTLVTTDGELIPALGGPYQVTDGGRRSLPTMSRPLARYVEGGGVELVGDGLTVSFEKLYRTQPWVATVVDKIARQIARLPLKVYEIDSQGNRQRVRDGRLPQLLRNPAPRRSATDLKQWLALPALVHGNAVLGMYRPEAGGPPTRLWPLDWSYLTPQQSMKGGPIDYWVSDQFEGRLYVDANDTVHVAWHPPCGMVGISPLQKLAVPLKLEDAAQRYQAAMMLNGARPPSAVTADESFLGLDREERAELLANLREDITDIYSGPENGGKPALLPPGLDWKSIGHTAHEAELIDQRKLSREEIAAVYDIPPPLVGILDHATYSNVSEMHRMLFTTVLGPWLTLIEETLQSQLIDPEPAFEGLFVEFDLGEVLKGDKQAEITALGTATDKGIMAVDEARDVLNLPRLGGDFATPRHQADRQQGDTPAAETEKQSAFQPTKS